MASLWYKLQSQTFKKVAGNIVIVVLVGFLATMFLLSLISFSNYVDSKSGPQTEPLQLYLDSFSVSNFRVSKSSFTAKWNADLTFTNRNSGLKVILYSFKVYVFHKERYPLSCAIVDEIEIGPKRRRTESIRFDTERSCGFERPVNGNAVLYELREDVKRGLLGFSLRMKISAFYRLRLLGLGTTVVLIPVCPDLNVEFVADNGEGKLVGGRNCTVPLPK